MREDSDFAAHVLDLLQPIGDVRSRAMFGGFGIYLGSAMFGLIAYGQLYFKVDDLTREDLREQPCHSGLLVICFDVRLEEVSMSKVPSLVPVTDLRQDAASVLKRVRNSSEPVFITQRGRAAAVMMSTEAFEKAEHDRQLLRLLARGDKEIAAGKGHDLESVLAEADALLVE